MVDYVPSTLTENECFLNDYIDSISIPYDDFLEGHILKSTVCSIFLDGRRIGFFGRLDGLITIFYIEEASFDHAPGILSDIIGKFSISEAFVPTTDLRFLSAALEKHTAIAIQACHFTATDKAVRPPEYPRDRLRPATRSDLDEIVSMAGDFLDKYEERIRRNELYVLEDGGEMVGLGVIVDNVLMRNCRGTGMFTRESRRGCGIGRSIILHLKEICREMNVTPVPGCWYGNTLSRKTLESAGYVSISRLLRISF